MGKNRQLTDRKLATLGRWYEAIKLTRGYENMTFNAKHSDYVQHLQVHDLEGYTSINTFRKHIKSIDSIGSEKN